MWWTVRQLAEHYRLSERTVYDIIASGELRAHRFGSGRGTIRVSNQDRIEWESRCSNVDVPSSSTPTSMRKTVSKDLIAKHFGM
ncbi:MAG: DNA-binding protein [Planctomycetota bacterium]|nr:MAG: DNA-binding protein [Planctomycetota bacterium]